MTLTNHLKKAAAGLGLLGILAGCGSSLPPARAHNDVYSRSDVSPQLKRSNALYDIRAILADRENCLESNVSEQGIYCKKEEVVKNCSHGYTTSSGLTTCSYGSKESSINLSWEEIRTYKLIVYSSIFGDNSLVLNDGNHINEIPTRDEAQTEQLKYSIEQYLRYRHAQ